MEAKRGTADAETEVCARGYHQGQTSPMLPPPSCPPRGSLYHTLSSECDIRPNRDIIHCVASVAHLAVYSFCDARIVVSAAGVLKILLTMMHVVFLQAYRRLKKGFETPCALRDRTEQEAKKRKRRENTGQRIRWLLHNIKG